MASVKIAEATEALSDQPMTETEARLSTTKRTKKETIEGISQSTSSMSDQSKAKTAQPPVRPSAKSASSRGKKGPADDNDAMAPAPRGTEPSGETALSAGHALDLSDPNSVKSPIEDSRKPRRATKNLGSTPSEAAIPTNECYHTDEIEPGDASVGPASEHESCAPVMLAASCESREAAVAVPEIAHAESTLGTNADASASGEASRTPQPNDRTTVTETTDQRPTTGSAAANADTRAEVFEPSAAVEPANQARKPASKAAKGLVSAKGDDSGLGCADPAPTPEAQAAVPNVRTVKPTDAKQDRPVSATGRTGKTGGSARQGFKASEFIVYPAHGVGQIVAIEEQVVAGYKLELFVISFVKDKMTLKVPTSKAAAVGMRKLAEADVVKKAFNTLSGRARIKRTMWSRRAQEYEAKINSGDLVAIAEVVRDLFRSESQPEQSYSERQLYEAALDRMAREIVVVQKMTETESLKAIEAQLQKGPRRGKVEEIEPDDAEIEEAA